MSATKTASCRRAASSQGQVPQLELVTLLYIIVVSIIIINIIISTCSAASLLGSDPLLSSFMLILLAFFMMLSWSSMATDNSITADLSELWTLPRPGAGCLSASESQHTTTTDSTCINA